MASVVVPRPEMVPEEETGDDTGPEGKKVNVSPSEAVVVKGVVMPVERVTCPPNGPEMTVCPAEFEDVTSPEVGEREELVDEPVDEPVDDPVDEAIDEPVDKLVDEPADTSVVVCPPEVMVVTDEEPVDRETLVEGEVPGDLVELE